jgi:hypothetical protein
LGSIEPIKKWARFELRTSGDIYWTSSIDVRKDCDFSNIHTSVHKSGKIFSSRYLAQHGQMVKVKSNQVGDIGGSFSGITIPHQITYGQEYLEPGFLYSGLSTLSLKDKKIDAQHVFVPCLDNNLVESRLYFSLHLVPWVDIDAISTYFIATNNLVSAEDNYRYHLFIFRVKNVSIVVCMKFTGGCSPIDVQKVAETDKNIHPLKRIYVYEKLALSESTSLNISKDEK